ncbi:Fpg/Nei family DNA glycosylase [Aurantimicrobium photophilum]|uniref:DNA-(apurinic or apyrimidinic site) lyase n=1 Tax=Aurantimicrobium photophilum TaxID=1987356 RepID=A0A2Z3S673_9MICO|nr:DNA-formamidopyrimidine glycosylase family protein [Aurantimicrobium photophilum]AWR21652.1 Endonuclease 8 1 [Aurantimicrobium photophilum]
MPEGHSVHRIARQFERNFVGHRIAVSSPQGRFAEGAAVLNGTELIEVWAVGKQMFMGFAGDHWLRIHLGIYGAWDFSGDIQADATIASANGRMGQTNQRGTVFDAEGENSLTSIGAPRKTRVRMAEAEKESALDVANSFPPEPIGQVRVRLLTDTVCADLRGPTACEVLTQEQVDAVLNRLGPDPQRDPSDVAGQKFVDTIRKKNTAIGLLLMDQSVVAGIGNVYRAEMLFRAGIDPYRPGKLITEDEAWALWRDWVYLLEIGVQTGQMMTIDGLEGEAWRKAMANRADRHWVYKREGMPCLKCGTNIRLDEMANRKLYWCPSCQT